MIDTVANPKLAARTTALLWMLVMLYALARVSQAYPQKIPILAIVGLHVLAPLLFASVHGAIGYRPRGILAFTLLCLLIGNALENLSIATGFPFGHYHFTDVMGPKLFQVPIFLGLAYIGMGYVSWTLGLLIAADLKKPLSGYRLVAVPLVAALVMVAWDLSMDPIWSNLVHGWVWQDGGAYFGVPVSNFFGWYLTVYLIYQSFALYLRRTSIAAPWLPRKYWTPALAFYAVSAMGNLFVATPSGQFVTDAAGTIWSVRAMLGTSDLISVFVMGGFTLPAWVRLAGEHNRFGTASPAQS